MAMLSTFIFLFTLTCFNISPSEGKCSDGWLDCGNGKCVSYIWRCDHDNDCGNNKDEENCDSGVPPRACLTSQFQCVADGHCITDTWHCDGEHDCEDGSDEKNCDNDTHCHGFKCNDNHCIPEGWKCDGRVDCPDGSDEDDRCPKTQICSPSEFTCSSGTCLDRKYVCDGKKDCPDASDEGKSCSDVCASHNCTQKCRKTPTGPECYCNDGYLLGKDNRTCSDVDECQREGTCSQTCTNLVGSYRCSCLDGYELENTTCKASGPEPLLVFSTLQEIRAMYLRTKRYFLIQKAIHKAAAVDADSLESRVYWVEVSNKSTVYSSKIDGTGFGVVLHNGLMIPEDIAVDYVGKNLYFTDSGLKQILACKTDGTMCYVLHRDNIQKPRAIAVDPPEGLLYWSDWGDNSSGIYRSGMDGSRRVILVSKDIKWPNGIAIDHSTNRLYWTDAHTQTIEYITLDGRTRKVLLRDVVYHPYSIAVFEDQLYWSDWNTFSLDTCNKFTTHVMNILVRENGKHIMGVHVYHPILARKANNPCWSNTCSHMCLIAPLGQYKCVCPPGFTLSDNGRTCLIDESFPMLFVNDEARIYHLRPESVGSSALTELPIAHIGMIGRLAYDWKTKTLYITDMKSPAIYSINMTSLVRRELIKNHLVTPEDLAFDWISDKLYWVDSSKGTVEVISPVTSRVATLVVDLTKPTAIALEPRIGRMFVSEIGAESSITMYDMDGMNKLSVNAKTNSAVSLAVHPSLTLLYWADSHAETISYIDYLSPRSEPRLLKSRLGSVVSIAVSDKYFYWTDTNSHVINIMRQNSTMSHTISLPGSGAGLAHRRVTYTAMPATARALGQFPCSVNNGGCSYLCLTAQNGRSCACSSGMILSKDNATCINKECTPEEFQCKHSKKCVPLEFVCDDVKDCDDGTDEICDEPSKRCPGNDFQCTNGRCILQDWKCDHRDDCGDNSDEIGCPVTTGCANDQFSCSGGECIPNLWRCDGENDCHDGSDEKECHSTACNPDSQIRCDHGQCIPISWACDGTPDCLDGSDEGNCTNKPKTCSFKEFRCDDGTCIDKAMSCDHRPDCMDGSDERNCSNVKATCMGDQYLCKDGFCIYAHEVCDGRKDCSDGSDEHNCTQTASHCSGEEYFCVKNSKCISKRWICDGDDDCGDASDEDPDKCMKEEKPTLPPYEAMLECEEFFCIMSGECIPWSKVCDDNVDCRDLSDEGPLCSKSCINNGGCSQKCTRTPEGSKCSCFNGYELLSDKVTCEDIDECSIPGSCSHFCNNTKGSFKCSCAEGYFLEQNHRNCKADGGPATLVYLLPDQIRGIDLSSHSQRIYFAKGLADMRGMDYDASGAIFYFGDWKDGTINSYTPNTNKRSVLLTTPIRPHFVRWDWIARSLYYTDDAGNILACSSTGQYCATIVKNAAPHINSFDISPKNGLMFWGVWNSVRHQNEGIIERAEMDGRNRIAIVEKKIFWPSAVSVDHVTNMIYWIDTKLNIMESSDFHGLNRRTVVAGNMSNPYSMALFEDYVFWADWGSDKLIRSNKFTGRDFLDIRTDNVKAEVMMVVHKAQQTEGLNRCRNINCSQICLQTNSNAVCKCADGYFEVNSTCEMITTIAPASKVEISCPDNYCRQNANCVVVGDKPYCQCPPEYKGERCETRISAAGPEPTPDISWVVGVLLAIMVIAGIVIMTLLVRKNRDKLSKVSENVAVSFRNKGFGRKSSRLIVDNDDTGACDELMLGQSRESKKTSFGNPLFGKKHREVPDPESQDGDFKRWPSYDSAFVSEPPSMAGSQLSINENPLGRNKTTGRIIQFFKRP